MALGNKEWVLHFEKEVRILECRSLETQILESGKSKTYVFETPSLLKGDEGTCHVFIYETEMYVEWVKNSKVTKSVTLQGSTKMHYEDGKLRIITQKMENE